MTGREIMRTYLTELEKFQALHNIEWFYHASNNRHWLLDREYKDYVHHNFIGEMCVWSETEEGFDYWSSISNRVRLDIKIKIITPYKFITPHKF